MESYFRPAGPHRVVWSPPSRCRWEGQAQVGSVGAGSAEGCSKCCTGFLASVTLNDWTVLRTPTRTCPDTRSLTWGAGCYALTRPSSRSFFLLTAVFPAGVQKTRLYNKAIELCNNKCTFFIFTPLNFYNKGFHLSLSLTGIIHFHILNFFSLSDIQGTQHCFIWNNEILFQEVPAQRIPLGGHCIVTIEARSSGAGADTWTSSAGTRRAHSIFLTLFVRKKLHKSTFLTVWTLNEMIIR